MNVDELNTEQKKIDAEVRRIAEQLNAEPVYDGIYCPEHHLLSPIKTAWVLREPNDLGGCYDYKTLTIEKVNNNDIGRKKYTVPMMCLEYSLSNNLAPYTPKFLGDQDVAVLKLLLNTAFINISKIVGGAKVNYETFWNYVDKFSDVVKQQLTIAKPQIIIASGTIKWFQKYGYLKTASTHPKAYRKYYATGDNIILDCYHLGQRNTISGEALCNDIISAVKDARSKGFLQ